MNWFECKVKYEKTSEEGLIKSVIEAYLIDAMSFTEAEARINSEMAPFVSSGLEVTNIKKIRVAELFDSQDPAADKWYKSKVYFIITDDTGKDKKSPNNMYVKAGNIKEALENLLEGMKGSMVDYEIALISDTVIMDVFQQELVISEEE